MIPQSLKLENFMAYAEASLDFRSFRIACLAGHNGAGKSTILDALTWVLFDKARAGDSDELIRVGASDMRVELSFLLENQQYRVLRTRKRKGKGKSSGKSGLEFQLLTENGFRSLTGKKISETQRQIESTLKMNYGLFVNSSFILQGRADAFTTASPAERKQVLADILQLEAYEQLRQEAIETRRGLRLREAELRHAGERIAGELDAEAHLSAHLADARLHRAQQQQLQQALSAEAETLTAVAASAGQLRSERQHAAERLQERQNQLLAAENQLERLHQQRQHLSRWLNQAAEIEAAYQALLADEAAFEAHEAEFERYLTLENAHRQLEQRCERERHQLDLLRTEAGHRLKGLQQQRQSLEQVLQAEAAIRDAQDRFESLQLRRRQLLTLQKSWHELEKRLLSLEQAHLSWAEQQTLQEQTLQTQLRDGEQQLSQHASLQQEAETLHQQLQQLNARQLDFEHVQTRGLELRHELENLQRSQRETEAETARIAERMRHLQAHKDSICPTCERLLTAADLELLLDKYRQEAHLKQRESDALSPQIQSLEREITQMRQAYQRLSRELKPRESLQKRLGTLEARLEQLADLRQAVQTRTQTLEAQRQARAARETDWQRQLTELRQQSAELGFSESELIALELPLRQLQNAPARFEALEQAIARLPDLTQEQQAYQRRVQDLEAQAQALTDSQQRQLAASAAALAALAAVPERRKQLQLALQTRERARDGWHRLQEARIREEAGIQQVEEWERHRLEAEAACQQLLAETRRLEALLAEMQPRLAELPELEARIVALREADAQAHAEIYSLAKELESLQQRKAELAAQAEELGKIQYEMQLYEVLEDSFGKNGLQAVLIENALPEIEQIANDMLAGMSEGRMHIKLQTLRSYKTRDKLAETLDILISDELGTRSYETFSTGEAFRVNFALRLAISKLLARRAGARLQTLVIDEGFGSQDAQGKTRLIEAINTVAPDFATILVITHVDDLKALFPCRIEIHKEAGGSRLQVLHV